MPRRFNRNRINTSSLRTKRKMYAPFHENQKLDRWLLRLSYLSQFGLFLFTVFTIYFTVIPLYQKALLDEAIAKKEFELKHANEALEKAYARIRSSLVKDFVLSSGFDCTGLSEPPTINAEMGETNNKPTMTDKILALDVRSCMNKTVKNSVSLHDLRPEDRSLLEQKVLGLGEELLSLRQRAITEHREVPARVYANPRAFPAPKGYTEQALKVLAILEPREKTQQRLLEATIRAEQFRIGMAYDNAVRQKIATLRSIEWPKSYQLDKKQFEPSAFN